MQNLYTLIMQLNQTRSELYKELTTLEHSVKVDKQYYREIHDKFVEVDEAIKDIEKEYKIGVSEMSNMLKTYTGVSFEPKIFAEMVARDGENRYTHQYVACYINKQHPYYRKKNTDIIYLYPDEYNQVLHNLSKRNSIIFSSSDKINFDPFEPSLYLDMVNFIYLFTRGHVDSIIASDFIKRVSPFIKKDLEATYLIANDNEFKQGI
ncbi:MAG: hypothetical protein IJA72_03755 [Clostridia bacterium]|nr:hypothetical protein [Clostridia bacterium]